MQNTTSDYKLEITKDNIEVESKIIIGNNVYTSSDVTDLVLEYTQPQEGFAIGNTPSQSLDLTLLNRGDIIYNTSPIKLEIGLKIGSKIEYIQMGIFNIDDIEKTDYTIKITAYDNMIKFERNFTTSLGNNLTLQQVVSELSRITGVEFTGSLPSYTVKKLEGFSCREVLGYVASICGGNAVITRDGKFTIKGLTEVKKNIDGHNIILNNYKTEEVKYKVGQVTCQADEGTILSKGSLGTDSMEVQFENPWVNESILNDIYNKIKSVEYLGYSMKWTGDLALDIYDIVSVTDAKNVTRKIPILSQKLTCTKGIISEMGAKGETKNKNSFSSSGSTTNKVNRTVMELAIIDKALIDKANIRDLEAVSIRTQNLEAKTAKIEEAIINVAHIEDLTAINANIQNLIAADANITKLIATKADITDLTATNIKFEVGSGGILDLQTLLSKFITGENGQFINLTTDNVVIANALIKDVIAKNISVEDLIAGRISTNKFTVASDDGGITIVGPTMQFKDKNNKVRIQMGQDTHGNFNFILRGEDGTTTLIDHTGIKEKAICDDLIKGNMVAADAIGEKQINYSSFITGLNKDDNTSLIKASKVAIDLEGQTLDVAFNSLKTNVDNIEIGGRNFIKDSNFIVEATKTTNAPNKSVSIVSGLNLTEIFLGKTVTFSYFVNNPGNRQNGSGSLGNRFGIHGAVVWRDSTGKLPDKGGIYPFADCLTGSFTNKRVVMNYTFKPPTGYDTIASLSFSFQPFARPADDNDSIWRIGKPKLEIGTKVTDWTPAPEDAEQKIEANTTSISIAQGKIDGLIKETSITKGDVTTLKDNYTSIKATVDKINTTVASHTSSIGKLNTDLSGVSGKVTTVENKYASLEQNLNGFKTTVADTYSTKKELSNLSGTVSTISSKVSTAESSITQLKNQITQKVEATDVANAINSINSENLVIDGSFENGYGWTGNAVIESGIGIDGGKCLRLNASNLSSYTMEKSIDVVPGKKYKLSAWYKTSSDNNGDSNNQKVRLGYLNGTLLYAMYLAPGATSWTYKEEIVTIPKDVYQIRFSVSTNTTKGYILIDNISFVSAELEENISKVSNKVASIETNLSSITQRVASTETNVKTINGNITSLQSRMSSAESKITSTAIINTVQSTINNAKNEAINSANKTTDSKLQNYATKASMELTASQLRLDFTSSGGYNLLRNGCFLNDRTHWGNWTNPTLSIINSPVGYGKCIKIVANATNTGVQQQVNNLEKGKKYTLSAYVKADSGVCAIQVNNNRQTWHSAYINGTGKWQWLTVTFTANATSVIVELGRNGQGSNGTYYYTAVMLQEGSMKSAYSPHPDEIYSGNTIIDANGVTIRNGAFTVLNKAGAKVLYADSNGDIAFTGRLQPNDYQVKLFGNECKIDGSKNAIRMQLDPQTYVSVDGLYVRTFNKYSKGGTIYGSIGINPEGHLVVYGQRTMLKLLGNGSEQAIVQARWASDTAYAAFAGSDFLNRSTMKDKTNVAAIEEVSFTKILLENNIRKYNLKTDVENMLNRFNLEDTYSIGEVVSSSAETRLGFILEELTPEARTLLSPGMESISIYSMCSILWKVCQEQQKRIETLESKIS